MYHYKKAICLARSLGSQWKEADISNILVFDIFNTYSKVYLELTHTDLVNSVYVDFDVLRNEFSSYSDTLINLLIHIDNRTLPTVSSLPNSSIKYVKYSDAFRSEYKIKTTIAGQELPANFPIADKVDLEITRPKYSTDLSLIHTHALVSVNGYIHPTDTDGTRLFVYNGGKTMRKGKINHLGILSFLDVGQLTKVKLKESNIFSQDNSSLKEKIYFTIDEDITNKSYFLVLGGYLVFPDEYIFHHVGEKTFMLDINNLPYLERLCESDLYIDLSEVPITRESVNPTRFNVAEAYSDVMLKKYLTMFNSFLVIVDVPQLITSKINIRHTSMPGMFICYNDPTYPLICSYGKIAEYWKVKEDGLWSVTVADSFLRNYILSQQPNKLLSNVNNNLVSEKPFTHSRGYLLEIAGFHI